VKHHALSRCGLEVGKQVRLTLIRRVQRGDVKYARKVTNSRTVIVLDHDGDEMAFLYSSAAKDIVSFLPPDAPETADWRCSFARPRGRGDGDPRHHLAERRHSLRLLGAG
jgi:hypothetical protein